MKYSKTSGLDADEHRILELSNIVKDLAKTIHKPDTQKSEPEVREPKMNVKEGYVNYNIDSDIIKCPMLNSEIYLIFAIFLADL